MLDFYLISDASKSPKSPKDLRYIGGLEDDVFWRLKGKGLIDKQHDYYSDFRWKSDVISQVRQRIAKLESDSDVQALKKIVDSAQNANSGAIAYGD